MGGRLAFSARVAQEPRRTRIDHRGAIQKGQPFNGIGKSNSTNLRFSVGSGFGGAIWWSSRINNVDMLQVLVLYFSWLVFRVRKMVDSVIFGRFVRPFVRSV